MTDPTTGGVTASFAMLVILFLQSQRHPLVAGPRVIEQTIGQKLPKASSLNFCWSIFVDAIVERQNMRIHLAVLLLHSKENNTMQVNAKANTEAPSTTDNKQELSAWDRFLYQDLRTAL